MGRPELGTLLRKLRHGAGLTLEELSELSGVSARAIGDMERGRSRSPQARTVQALSDGLRLGEDDASALKAAARAGRRLFPEPPATRLCGLPPSVPDFVGRTEESAWLAGAAGSDPRVSIVSGAPGLGKTALVVRTAALVADRHPDGCFFFDLRGLDPEPVEPDQVVRRLLRALEVREEAVPADAEDRLSLYHDLLRERRVLIVLDNAAHERQVRPLLPGPGPAEVWIACRRALTGIEHARRLPLQPLPAGAAADMLAVIVAGRTDGTDASGDQDTLREIADRCGHLPLALRIAGNRLLTRPRWTTRDLANRLAAEDLRLQRLSAGDLHVRSAFTLSYEQLTSPLRILFRRLSLVPGPDFGPAVGAVLTGLPPHRTEEMIDELIELGLLVPTTGDRAGFHDLIRLYARQRLMEDESAAAGRDAEDRLRTWLLTTARAAGDWFEPGHVPVATVEGDLIVFDDQAAAQRWLTAEDQNWFRSYQQAAQAGDHATVVAVAEAMHWYSDRCVPWGHWHEVFALSHAAAHALHDVREEAVHLNYLAWAQRACLGDFATSEAMALRAEVLARRADDPAQRGWALLYAAAATTDQGRHEQALSRYRTADAFFRESGEREGRSQALICIATVLSKLQRHEEAVERLESLLSLLTDAQWAPAPHIADFSRMNALRWLGISRAALGDRQRAVAAYRSALEMAPRVGIPYLKGLVLHQLGAVLAEHADHGAARVVLEEARDIFERAGNQVKVSLVDSMLASAHAG
ncbi:ATP-binding protein [Streptomyces sp. NPDC001770]